MKAYNISKLLRGENKSAVMCWISFELKTLQLKEKNTLEQKRKQAELDKNNIH